jgi:glycerol kinase
VVALFFCGVHCARAHRIRWHWQDGKIVEKHQIELPNLYPQEGWCEHDPAVIMDAVTTCIDETMKKVEGRYSPADVAAIGVSQSVTASALSAMADCSRPGRRGCCCQITNQRETTVVWDKTTGKPLHNAIVWLDLRTAETVAKYSAEADGGQDRFRAVCGLPLS